MAELNGSRIFAVDKFLGLNESADGETELKLGEASKTENFYITDEFNLKTRPGVVKLEKTGETTEIVYVATGNIAGRPWRLIVTKTNTSSLWVSVRYIAPSGQDLNEMTGFFDTSSLLYPVKVFSFMDKIYVITGKSDNSVAAIEFSVKNGIPVLKTILENDFYVPILLSEATPDGGGNSLEKANALSRYIRLKYSADGIAKDFKLPRYVASVQAATVDNSSADGVYDSEDNVYKFDLTPSKGINNVELLCTLLIDDDIMSARMKFLQMKHAEAYNGATDTRLFFYGDGTNVCFYTGITEDGQRLYLPLGNEIKVDTSASPITAMVRNYSSLIGFQPDGAFVINYEPITLADGNVTAGFFMRTASREFGNEMDGQVQTVNNYLRTVCDGSIYEWKYLATQYQDERYAKCISSKVRKTIAKADPSKIVTCDDNTTHTYYMFLNDENGTVLVNRYDLDVWTVYKGNVFRDVRFAAVYDGNIIFCNRNVVFKFDTETRYDDTGEEKDEEPITAVWESGYMYFGAAYKKKYSSTLWVSLLPEHFSDLEVTVKTDKREDYITKAIGYLLANFSNVDFSNFSFLTWAAPKIKRVQLKVKKFVYYKLIFRVTKPGARATILGYDQQVRYSSNVK